MTLTRSCTNVTNLAKRQGFRISTPFARRTARTVFAVVPNLAAIRTSDQGSDVEPYDGLEVLRRQSVAPERNALPMQVYNGRPAVDSEQGTQVGRARAGSVGGVGFTGRGPRLALNSRYFGGSVLLSAVKRGLMGRASKSRGALAGTFL